MDTRKPGTRTQTKATPADREVIDKAIECDDEI